MASAFGKKKINKKSDGLPVKHISSCEMDFNKDGVNDIATMIKTSRGTELIALIKSKKGYRTQVLKTGEFKMKLICRFGKTIAETVKGDGMGRTFKTNGTLIELTKPKTPPINYYWKKNRFIEVVTMTTE